MPRLFSVRFDWSRWRPVKNSTHQIAWLTPGGDSASLHFSELPPDLPVKLSEIDGVRRFYREIVSVDGGGIISADVVRPGGIDAVKLVMKYRQKPGTRAVKNVGMFVLLWAEHSYIFRVESVENGAIGMRESAAFTELRRSVGASAAVPQSEWARDPYDPQFEAPFPRNQSDDERWDEVFPEHPLSRVRHHLTHFEETLQLDPELLTLAPFER